ncbi:hypothetical protein C4568_03915 [Candidatus Parcubacteria bacterium]|nr:MAG: hypothetical protein C4568_03915 [Candidatus Parcubacteria bacterium]
MAKQKTGKGKDVGLALAGAALAAAAAGYYFYGSDDAKKHRAKAAKWAVGFKKEVEKQVQRVGTIDRATIAAAVDRAAKAYANARTVGEAELGAAAKELKKHWRDLAEEVGKGAKKKRAKNTTKRASKKNVAKKSSK